MKKLNKNFDNENGSALVIVMMVLVVVSALGGALGMVTINSHRLAEHTQDTNSAYYIAEAGANMAYEEFKTHVLSAYETHGTKGDFDRKVEEAREDIDNTIYGESYFPSNDSDKIEAVIEIIKLEDEESTHVIRSTGKVDGKTRTVEKDIKVTWVDKGSGDSNPSDSFPIDLSNALTYNSNVLIHKHGTIRGTILYPDGTPYIKELPNIDELTHEGGKKTFNRDKYGWWEQQTTISSWLLPIIENRIKEFDFTGAESSIIHSQGDIIFNNNADVNGHIVTNKGNINFNNNAIIKGDVIANGGSITFNNNATVYGNIISTGGSVILGSGGMVTGSIVTVGNGSNIRIQNGPGVVSGNLMAGGGEISLGTKITIRGATINPSGKILANGNKSELLGPVIADNITIGQNSLIDYSDNYLNFFPFNNTQGAGDGNAGGAPIDGEETPRDISDIISSTPATEN